MSHSGSIDKEVNLLGEAKLAAFTQIKFQFPFDTIRQDKHDQFEDLTSW